MSFHITNMQIDDNAISQQLVKAILKKIYVYWTKHHTKCLSNYHVQKFEFDESRSILYIRVQKKMHINVIIDLDADMLIINIKNSRIIESTIYQIPFNDTNKLILYLINVSIKNKYNEQFVIYLIYFLLHDLRDIQYVMLGNLEVKILQFIKQFI